MFDDLATTRQRIHSGQTSAASVLEQCIAQAQTPRCAAAFVSTDFARARSAASPAAQGLPLAGLAVSIKDLFDVAGETTAAGSIVLKDAPPAARDCPAVERLRAAGAALIGRTHMVEFAFSGIGTNPHFATPPNVADTRVDRIPGGSSSGAAVSVGTGAAFIGLGSDTGGSIRIPAALNGLVGFKSTARLVPTEGALPLSITLDTVCAVTRSVADAVIAHEVLSVRKVATNTKPLSARRFAVVQTIMLDALDPSVAAAFTRSLRTLRDAGARIDEIVLTDINDVHALFVSGGFSGAESYAWHRHLLAQHAHLYDPRVAMRIRRGAAMLAYEYLDLHRARTDWIGRMSSALADFDAVLSPTVPIVAVPIADVAPAQGLDAAQDAARDAEFFRVNALLLRNTSVVNQLDGCAISIPCHEPGDTPVGLMIWHTALHDDAVLNIALQAESALRRER